MDKNREYGEGPLFAITNGIYWIATLSLGFFISNIVLIAMLFLLYPSFNNAIFYLLGFIILGPSLSAMYACLIQLHEKKYLEPMNDYFMYYKANIKDTLRIWVPYCILMFLFVLNIRSFFFRFLYSPFAFGLAIIYFLIGLSIIISLSMIMILIINVKFKFKTIDIVRLGFFYTFTKVKISIVNICIVILSVLAVFFHIFLLLIIVSVACYFIVKNSHSVIEDITKRFIK